MKTSSTPLNKKNTPDEARKLADFVLFSQRNCILPLSQELNQGKLSYPQFFLLAYLAEEEGLTMSNIAKMMGHSTAAATGMVDKLQELGYTSRFTASADRRKIMVRITEKGLAIVEQMRGSIAENLANLMAGNKQQAEPVTQARKVLARHRKLNLS